ncbi:hypothetical protein N9917_01365 [Deltaproteobacteria bacterium]|nr:hypothetical protein [Deltaproteobacteria bacterium]
MSEEEEQARYCANSLDELLAQAPVPPEMDIPKLRTLVSAGQTGSLTEVQFRTLSGCTAGWGIGSMSSYYYRSYYCKAVSWSVYTTEFIDSMQRLTAGRRVLEVCAGRGTLSRVLRGRGEDWTATDLYPVTDDVEALDALEAVRTYKPEVIVVSWVPYGSNLDEQLADLAKELGIPMVIIGEGNGGCTGSGTFWNRGSEVWYDDDYEEVENGALDWNIHSLGSLFDWFTDVPRWNGINDYTSIVLPVGVVFVCEGKGVFGPVV